MFFKLFENNFKNSKKCLINYYDCSLKVISINEVEFKENYDKVYQILKDNKISSNSFIGIILRNFLALPAIILGINKNGNGFICLNFENFENKHIISKLKIKYLFVENKEDLINFKIIKTTPIRMFDKYNLYLSYIENTNTLELLNQKKYCYAVLTSGTTGKSKIVCVPFECILPNIMDLRSKFLLSEKDVIFFNTPITFDPYIIEIFLFLTTNATLVIIQDKISFTNDILDILFTKEKITFLQTTPSLFFSIPKHQIVNIILNKNTSLNTLAFGGEDFPTLSIKSILNESDNKTTKIYNLYGVTEFSCWASICLFNQSMVYQNDNVPLGEVLSETEFKIENDNQTQTNVGELLIISKIRETTIIDEDGNFYECNVHRTGDIVEIIGQEYYFLSRKHDMIKRYGSKIYLNEIEKLIYKHLKLPIVCACMENKIVAFLKCDINLNINQLKLNINQVLHDYKSKTYTIDVIRLIKQFPLSSSNKIDKNQLVIEFLNGKNEFKQKRNTVKISLKELVEEFLKKQFCLENLLLYYDKTFIELGGTSTTALQLTNKINETFDSFNIFDLLYDLKLKDLFKKINEIDEITEVNMKKIKTNENFNLVIDSKYNLQACIDGSPCIYDDKYLIIGSHAHIVLVIDLSKKMVLNKIQLPDRIESTVCLNVNKSEFFIGCYDGVLYSIDLLTGEIVWSYKTQSKIKSTPVLCRNNEAIVFGSYDKYFYCLLNKNGNLIWKQYLNGSIGSAAVLKNSKIFIANILGVVFCLDEINGSIIWNYDTKESIFGSPCLILGNIAWGSVKGNIKVFNCNGSIVNEYRVANSIFSPLISKDNLIYFGCYDKHFYCLEYKQEKILLKFKIDLNYPIYSQPFLFSQNLIVISNIHGDIFLLENENILCQVSLPSECFSSPIVNKDYVYVGCRDDFLYCLKITLLIKKN